MWSRSVSPFRSSSDCSTAHVSRAASQTTGDDGEGSSKMYSQGMARPVATMPTATNSLPSAPPSDAFVSFRSGPTVQPGSSAFVSPADGASCGSGQPRRRGGGDLRIALPAGALSPSVLQDDGRSPAASSEQHATLTADPLVLQRSPASGGVSPTGGAMGFPPRRPGSPTTTAAAQRAAAARQRSQSVLLGSGAALASPHGASSPLVPTSRGFGSERRSTLEPQSPAQHLVPPLPPPARPPSGFLTSPVSRSGSVHCGSRHASAAASPDAASPQPLASFSTTAGGGWWAATRRFVSNRGEQINAYLEEIVNPGGVAAAASSAAEAGGQAQTREAARRPSSAVPAPSPRVQGRLGSAGASQTLTSGRSRNSTEAAAAARPHRRASRVPTSPATATADRHLEGFEPFSGSGAELAEQEEAGPYTMPLERIVINTSHEPFVWQNANNAAQVMHSADRTVPGDSFMNAFGSGSDSDADNVAPNAFVVDLVSALRGYLSSQTEVFGHLVAAALASRSRETPVHGFELAAADHNPYLVRLILDSGKLDVDDAEAQQHVQETLDALLSTESGVLSPAIYDYLNSFFRVPFVRLSHAQYTQLKRGGFEYIKLMYDHQHVLPDERFHSIMVHQSRFMHCLNLTFMLIHLGAVVMCTIAFAIVLANWMRMEKGDYQSYGFYTLIVFGGGWALNLIFTMCIVRSHEDERLYEPRPGESELLSMPSPYVAVVPVLPLFDIFCVVSYVRALRNRHMILSHNILTCSRLSGILYATMYAFPQFITQSYFNNIEVNIEARLRHQWSYTVLLVTTIAQWSVALFRYAFSTFTHDSIDGFGFACFNQGKVPHWLERHNGVAHVMHYLMVFVFETNLYLLIATALMLPKETCDSYSGIVLVASGVSIGCALVIYLVLLCTDGLSVRISFSCVLLVGVQAVLLLCSERVDIEECGRYRDLILHSSFIFGYLSWGAYFIGFLLWLALLVQWCVLCTTEMNIFPRMTWLRGRKRLPSEATPGTGERGSNTRKEGDGGPDQVTLSSSQPVQGGATPAPCHRAR